MTIRREIFKTNSDLTIAEYTAAYTSSGTALQAGRTGELVVDLADPAAPVLYIANNTSVLTAVGSGSTVTSLVNGTSNVVVAANSNITMGVAGTANVFTIAGQGNTTIRGTLTLGIPAVSSGNLGLFSSAAATTTFLVASGASLNDTTIVFPANAGSNGAFLRTDGSGTTSWATTFGNGTSNIAIASNANVTITSAGNTVATITGTGILGANGSATNPTYGFVSDGSLDTGFFWVSDGNIGVTNNGTQSFIFQATTIRQTAVAFASLPAATTAGLRGFINNGNLAAASNFGAQVAGGGSNNVPVFSDGTNWRIG
jgi:hypothetical protein